MKSGIEDLIRAPEKVVTKYKKNTKVESKKIYSIVQRAITQIMNYITKKMMMNFIDCLQSEHPL